MKAALACLVFASVVVLDASTLCLGQESSSVQSNGESAPTKIATKYLPNAIQVHPKVISGGQPDGEPAFQELKELGIKTIVSVDGAKPDVALARKYGLRYVHLPHGYDGISPERSAELAKGVRDLEGPIYLHCHHGKHRSPTAAAVACVSAGLLAPSSALVILKLAGTNENYRGLFACAAKATRIDDSKLDAMQVEFPEIAKLPPMAEAMVELEHTYDHLKQFSTVGWAKLPKHPELDPAHEALLMREHFKEMLRLEEVAKKPEAYVRTLKESESDSQSLEAEIRNWKRSTSSEAAPNSITTIFNRISTNCTSCHRDYRD